MPYELPMTLARIKRSMRPGMEYYVTNHYITDPAHYCYGTHQRKILRVAETAFWMELEGHPGGDRIPWPKAAQVTMDRDGTIHLFGGGASQAPDELYLTLRPVRYPAGTAPKAPA